MSRIFYLNINVKKVKNLQNYGDTSLYQAKLANGIQNIILHETEETSSSILIYSAVGKSKRSERALAKNEGGLR